MANTNDQIRAALETHYGGEFDVTVEGVPQELTPFRVVVSRKADGKVVAEAKSTMSMDEFLKKLK